MPNLTDEYRRVGLGATRIDPFTPAATANTTQSQKATTAPMNLTYRYATPEEIKERAARSYKAQEATQKLMRENPGMSYDEAFRTANVSIPAMPPGPQEVATKAMLENQGSPEWARKAGAKFAGMVQAAVHQHGIPFEAAWNAMKAEEPELYAEMCEGQPGTPRSNKAELELARQLNS